MGDWKKALREIKKVLPNTTQAGSNVRKTLPNPNQATLQRAKQVHVTKKPGPTTQITDMPDKSKRMTPSICSSQYPRIKSPAQSINQLPQGQKQCARPEPVKPVGVPDRFGEVQTSALTRQQYFKKPDPWVTDGARLQHTSIPKGGAIDIVIGLDFGTSYTKAAVGLKDQIFPVSWEGVSLFPDRYLLPTEYSELKYGECHVGQAPAGEMGQILQRLKHAFIDPAVSAASIAKGVVFVGLVLRYIRAWVYRSHGKKIGNSPIRWLLNIGAPSNGLEIGRLEAAYRKLACAAWVCSRSDGDLRMSNGVSSVNSIGSKVMPEGLLDLAVLPEFVGQIAGYVKSAQRKAGLHALVDVGGGTLDVVTFIVHEKDGEDVFPFLVPEVRSLGTQMLDHNRLVGTQPDRATEVDELQPVLDSSAFASRCGLPLSHVQQRDDIFWQAVDKVVHGVLWTTRQRRDPNSQHWTLGLPIFLTGGGAKVEGYVRTASVAGARVAKRLNIMPLPPHPSLADFSGDLDDYQRISVACGLAMDAMNLGQIRPAKEIEDMVIARQPTAPRLDHEDIYG